MDTLFEKLLSYYNLSLSDYDYLTRELSLSDIKDPYSFKDMDKVFDIVNYSLANDEKIMIYGDYDCDGIMATSILVKMFSYLNKDVGYYIPSRYIDGYGINIQRAKQIIEKGYKLVILCDNGIVANEEIKYLKDNNIKVIIIDHHKPGDVLPDADAIIHPSVSNFSQIATSAGFCSFMVSYAILKKIDIYLLILGAISIISDMMPLKDFNRDIVRLASSLYENNKYYALDLLKENDVFNYLCIQMKMAPKINAVGRLLKTNKINCLIKFLTSDDKDLIKQIYKDIYSINEQRKFISKNISIDESDTDSSAIVSIYDIEEGMVGLLANKVLNIYHKPTIIFTYDSNDSTILRGSIRVDEGYDAIELLKNVENLLINYGGHAFAGGVTIKKDKYNEFKEKIISICQKNIQIQKPFKSIEISISDINLSLCRLVESFSPFGEEFKPPIFKICNVSKSFLQLNKTRKHIITNLSIFSQIVAFNIDDDFFKNGSMVDLYGTISLHNYHGTSRVQFLVNKYFNNPS